jgi:hypothetical protein
MRGESQRKKPAGIGASGLVVPDRGTRDFSSAIWAVSARENNAGLLRATFETALIAACGLTRSPSATCASPASGVSWSIAPTTIAAIFVASLVSAALVLGWLIFVTVAA